MSQKSTVEQPSLSLLHLLHLRNSVRRLSALDIPWQENQNFD